MGGATRFIKLLSTPFHSLLLHRPLSLFLLRHLCPTTGYSRYLTLSSSIISLQQNLHTNSLKSHTPYQYSQSHPWKEWSNFIGSINHFHGQQQQQQQSSSVPDHGLLQAEDALVVYEEKELSDDFIRGAAACLAFARAHPKLIGLLSMIDIEVIVMNGTPFIFKSALDTARRMRAFLGADGANVLESDKESTVDIMKYILSYASKPVASSIDNSLFSRELVEASVRNLLGQITQVSFGNVEQNINVEEQAHRPVEQPVQLKRGDWICPKCSFRNFKRKLKCLKCEEARPKRLLKDGEWECPRCNFFNFGKNIACLRCDCKRPGEVASESGYNSDKTGKMDGKAAMEQGKDSDFVPFPPGYFAKKDKEMPHNIDSSAKLSDETSSSSSIPRQTAPGSTPDLTTRLYNDNDGQQLIDQSRKLSVEKNLPLNGEPSKKASTIRSMKDEINTNRIQRVSELYDVKDLSSSTADEDFPEILPMGRGENRSVVSKKKDCSLTSLTYNRHAAMEQEKNTDYVPCVPFPPGYFAKKDKEMPHNFDSSAKLSDETSSSSSIPGQTAPERTPNLTTRLYNDNDGQQLINQSPKLPVEKKLPLNGEPSKKTSTVRSMKDEINTNSFQRVSELHDFKDLSSSTADEDFPMGRGENRSVVSKKKDCSLTSPAYNRQAAVEQGKNTDYVPFVPFSPGYFSKKDKEMPHNLDSSGKLSDETSSSSSILGQTAPERIPDLTIYNDNDGKQLIDQSHKLYAEKKLPLNEEPTDSSRGSVQMSENQNGKSLEGSAVKESDPLDLCEEAKAERWFRRVISELSTDSKIRKKKN